MGRRASGRAGRAHRLIDFCTHPVTRRLIDRAWFAPTVFIVYQVARKLLRNFIYRPFIRPFKYLRRKPRYEELHPRDEVTLPRNNMAAGVGGTARRRTPASPGPRAP